MKKLSGNLKGYYNAVQRRRWEKGLIAGPEEQMNHPTEISLAIYEQREVDRMKNIFHKSKKDTYTMYLLGDIFYEDSQEDPVIEEVPWDIQEILSCNDPKKREEFRKKREEWEKEHNPNYYVHPRYWYKFHPGECGQGYRYAVKNYNRHIDERRKEQEAKLKAKFPPAIAFIVGRYVLEEVASWSYWKAKESGWAIQNQLNKHRTKNRKKKG